MQSWGVFGDGSSAAHLLQEDCCWRNIVGAQQDRRAVAGDLGNFLFSSLLKAVDFLSIYACVHGNLRILVVLFFACRKKQQHTRGANQPTTQQTREDSQDKSLQESGV